MCVIRLVSVWKRKLYDEQSHHTEYTQHAHVCVCVFVCELTLLGSVFVIPDKVSDESDVFSGGIVGDVGPKFPEKLTEIEEVILPMIKQTDDDQ